MLTTILPIIAGVLLMVAYSYWCKKSTHQKDLFFDCDNGDTYKLKFLDADNPFNDVECRVYKMKPNGKYKNVYSTYYTFSEFTDMKEMGKDAIAKAISKEQRQVKFIKTKNEFWGN